MSNPITDIKLAIMTKLRAELPTKKVIEWVMDDMKPLEQLQKKAQMASAGTIFVIFEGSDGFYQDETKPILQEKLSFSLYTVESQSSATVSSQNLDETVFNIKRVLNKLMIESVSSYNTLKKANLELFFDTSKDYGFTNSGIARLTNLQRWVCSYIYD